MMGAVFRAAHRAKGGWAASAAAVSLAAGAAAAGTGLERYARTRRSQCEEQPTIRKDRAVRLQKRMTALGHFSILSETEFNPSIVTFFLTLAGNEPLGREELAALWRERDMPALHPRFHQAVSAARPNHFLAKRTVEQESDEGHNPVLSHLSETLAPVGGRRELEERITRLQTDRWDLSDSLWHMYVADVTKVNATRSDKDGDVKTLLLFRGHHVLADGASMGAAFSDLFDEAAAIRRQIWEAFRTIKRKRKRRLNTLWKRWLHAVQKWMRFVAGSLQAAWYYATLTWHSWIDADPWREVKKRLRSHSSNDEDGTSRRTISWTDVAPVDQVKWVAAQLSDDDDDEKKKTKKITVNDVFVSCIAAALAKQLDHHRQRLAILQEVRGEKAEDLPRQKFMHVAVPVHLKGGVVLPGESVGNNLGAMVARVPGELSSDSSATDRLRAVSRELHGIKETPAALLSHLLAKGLSYSSAVMPASFASWMYGRANAGSIAVVSNNRGAPHPVHLAGRRVESFYGFVPLPPGVPVGVVLMSYAGKVNVSVTSAEWAVPDADQFLVWVLEEYLCLLEAAKAKQRND